MALYKCGTVNEGGSGGLISNMKAFHRSWDGASNSYWDIAKITIPKTKTGCWSFKFDTIFQEGTNATFIGLFKLKVTRSSSGGSLSNTMYRVYTDTYTSGAAADLKYTTQSVDDVDYIYVSSYGTSTSYHYDISGIVTSPMDDDITVETYSILDASEPDRTTYDSSSTSATVNIHADYWDSRDSLNISSTYTSTGSSSTCFSTEGAYNMYHELFGVKVFEYHYRNSDDAYDTAQERYITLDKVYPSRGYQKSKYLAIIVGSSSSSTGYGAEDFAKAFLIYYARSSSTASTHYQWKTATLATAGSTTRGSITTEADSDIITWKTPKGSAATIEVYKINSEAGD